MTARSSIEARRAERKTAHAESQARERLDQRRREQAAMREAEARRALERKARHDQARRAEAELAKRRDQVAARKAAAESARRLAQRPTRWLPREPAMSDAASRAINRTGITKKVKPGKRPQIEWPIRTLPRKERMDAAARPEVEGRQPARSPRRASEGVPHRPPRTPTRPGEEKISRLTPALEKRSVRLTHRHSKRNAGPVPTKAPRSSREVPHPGRASGVPLTARGHSQRPTKPTEVALPTAGRNALPSSRGQTTERAPVRPASRASGLAERARPGAVETDTPARDILVSRFTSGMLSGSLPWLVTEGRQLLTVDGDALVLRGVNLSGPRPGVVPLAIPADWPLNVVRLMVSAEIDEAGMAALDAGVAAQAEAEAYTILVTPVTALDDAPDAIEQLDITSLLALAEHYADEPAVLFEPILPAVAAAGDSGETSVERDARRMRSVLAPLRAVHPRALCLAPAPAGGLPLVSDGRRIPNLLYTLPARSDAASPGLGQNIGSALLPRFVADWRLSLAHGLGDEALLCRLAAAGIGWAANAGAPDWQRMNRGGAEPTAAGRWLLRALTLAAAWDPAPARAA